MLQFIGTGSAFKCELGNNSAYVKEKDSMLLIDCGGTVFPRLKNNNLLDGLKSIYILITHTHLDHIGSLGDLIFYCHYILKIKPIICYPGKKIVEDFLNIAGVSSEMYEIHDSMKTKINDRNLGNVEIIFNVGSHVPQMISYNISLHIFDEKIYYSGDSNYLDPEIIAKVRNNEISRIYEDTCGLDYEMNPHLSFKKLCSLVPDIEVRRKIYCMHIDESLEVDEVLKEGFNIV